MLNKTHQEKKQTMDISVQYLKGVGPERAKLLERLGLKTLEDMLYLFPRRYEDRSQRISISGLIEGTRQLIGGQVIQKKVIFKRRGSSLFRLVISDDSACCSGLWFNSTYLDKSFQVGQWVWFYGKAEREGASFQMIHPDYEVLDKVYGKRVHTGRIVPVYPSTQDMNPRALRTLQYELLVRHLRDLWDPLPDRIRERRNLVNKLFAMKAIHFPGSLEDLENAYRRLVFEEFFIIQLALAMSRKQKESASGMNPTIIKLDQTVLDEFTKLLSFQLTEGQQKAIHDIIRDYSKPQPMHRLIQGEVGSGKTTVAAFALYAMVCSGYQGAIMAPTEILAQQHYLTLSRLLATTGIQVGLLTQGQSTNEKDRVIAGARDGTVQIIVGTQALIQDRVNFKDLRLAVVDEQHKFGVMQRKFLQGKAENRNLLVMTATPIPRTLAMTLYGDLDLTTMSDVPKGRGRIETIWVGDDKREIIYTLMEETLRQGNQAFIVHPLVEESEQLKLKEAKGEFEKLKRRFSDFNVGLLHGQMKSEEKAKVMQEFKLNRIRVLVSTSIVEVGVDIPNANMLVIENAERFGLSQLHQLRGRIGRGHTDATCILISDSENPATMDRLRAFTQLESGFDIAEEDLKLRGPGDFFGIRQHGLPALRIGDLIKDITLLEAARSDAFDVIKEDAFLSRSEHRMLKREVGQRFRKLRGSG